MPQPIRFRVRMGRTTESFMPTGLGFPIDMLRYDACYPATSDDAVKISASIRDARAYIEIYAWPESYIDLVGQVKPRSERWKSFGWEVV